MRANRFGSALLGSVAFAVVLAAQLHAGGVQGQDNAPGFVDKFVWITALSDSPDPFSPSAKGMCSVATSYRVRVHPGDTSDGKSPQTTFTRWLRQSVTITNQAGALVRTLETVKQLPEPEGKVTGLETQDMDVATGWDGRTQAGSMAPDGLYRYAVVGTYFRRAQTPGNVQEHVFGITSEKTGEVTLDNTPPTISASQEPPPTGGWNNTDVKVTFSAQDNLSGIAELTQPVTVTEEGKDVGVRGQAKDNAGNVAELTYKVSIDKTPPTITASQEPAPTGAWNRTDVVVTFEAEDKLSGVAEVTAPVTATEEGEDIEVPGSATDQAGNTSYTMYLVSMDKTPPETVVSRSVEPNKYGWNNTDVKLTLTPADAMSGVAHTYVKLDGAEAQDTTELTVSAEGEHTVKYWSVDEAGNAEMESTIQVRIDKTPPPAMTLEELTFIPEGVAHIQNGVIITEQSAITFKAPTSPDVVQALAFADNPALTVGAVLESVRVDIAGLAPGDYLITVRLIDVAGNKKDNEFPIRNVAQTGPPDSDHDGIPDEAEIRWGLDPNDPSDAGEDPDHDGLTNLEEWQNNADPNDDDVDNDGMPDGYEKQYGLDMHDPADATGDLDEDGWTNVFEWEIGTEPDDAGSGLAPASFTTGPGTDIWMWRVATEGYLDREGHLQTRFQLLCKWGLWYPYMDAGTLCGTETLFTFPSPLKAVDGPMLSAYMVVDTEETEEFLEGECALTTPFVATAPSGQPEPVSIPATYHIDPMGFGEVLPSSGALRRLINRQGKIPVLTEPPDLPAAGDFCASGCSFDCSVVTADLDMEIQGATRVPVPGEKKNQKAPHYVIDPQEGTEITVHCTLEGYLAPSTTWAVSLAWPKGMFTAKKPDGTSLTPELIDSGQVERCELREGYVWALKRTSTPPPADGGFLSAWMEPVTWDIEPTVFGEGKDPQGNAFKLEAYFPPYASGEFTTILSFFLEASPHRISNNFETEDLFFLDAPDASLTPVVRPSMELPLEIKMLHIDPETDDRGTWQDTRPAYDRMTRTYQGAWYRAKNEDQNNRCASDLVLQDQKADFGLYMEGVEGILAKEQLDILSIFRYLMTNNECEQAITWILDKYDPPRDNLLRVIFAPWKDYTYTSNSPGKDDAYIAMDTFGDALLTENWLAALIGHENVHGGQNYLLRGLALISEEANAEIEIEAYQWQLDHADDFCLSTRERASIQYKIDQFSAILDSD